MISPQIPLPSGFGAHTTALEALAGANLHGKVAIVTGGYAGLGLETTRVLAGAGATVIVPARTPEKARQALEGIPNVKQAAIDLLDPASITAFAQSFVASGWPLHMLVNNAGIMAIPELTRDPRGYEIQFAANHLGHFQLTAQLWPALRRTGGARVVSVSSLGHRYTGVDFDDLHFERRAYDKWKAYGQSKTANILFALALDVRSAAHGVRAFSLHPGRILDTDLARHLTQADLQSAGIFDENGNVKPNAGLKNVEQGAATNVWCATSSQLDGHGGVYCEDCDVAVPVPADHKELFGLRPWAINPDFAERLWTLSEALTGVSFEI